MAIGTADLFSLREAAVLAQLPEDRARREVERHVMEPARTELVGAARRVFFGVPALLYFAMLRSTSGIVELTPKTRSRAAQLLVATEPDGSGAEGWPRLFRDGDVRRRWVSAIDRAWADNVNSVLRVDWDALIDEVGPRIDIYLEGRRRIRVDDAILGGEPVFAGTRLAVRHIGGMRLAGEPAARIVEDYPDLSIGDVEFAALFTAANPPLGRPKAAISAAP